MEQSSPEYHDLAGRVKALESQRQKIVTFVFQYLLSPLLVVAIGYFFSSRIEKAKEAFSKLELHVKQIEAAQKMLNELFSGTPERAFIAESLISKVVEKDLSEHIHKIVSEYYANEVKKSISADNTQKIEEIAKATRSIESVAAQDVIQQIEQQIMFVVAASFSTLSDAKANAEELRNRGYTTDVWETVNGTFAVTIGELSYEKAVSLREKAVAEGHIKDDAYVASGRTFVRSDKFYVVAASFADKTSATRFADSLTKKNFDAEVWITDSGNFAVTIGYLSKTNAKKLLEAALGNGDIDKNAYLSSGYNLRKEHSTGRKREAISGK